jgi:hypothetical protein
MDCTSSDAEALLDRSYDRELDSLSEEARVWLVYLKRKPFTRESGAISTAITTKDYTSFRTTATFSGNTNSKKVVPYTTPGENATSLVPYFHMCIRRLHSIDDCYQQLGPAATSTRLNRLNTSFRTTMAFSVIPTAGKSSPILLERMRPGWCRTFICAFVYFTR